MATTCVVEPYTPITIVSLPPNPKNKLDTLIHEHEHDTTITKSN